MKVRLQQDLEFNKQKLLIEYGELTPEKLFDALVAKGIKPGGVLLVQSSLGDLYNFKGTVHDIIDVLEALVGEEGTLLMPAHTHYEDGGRLAFDVRKSPAHTGLICEYFRRKEGVVRSLHPTHSVCARGPLAKTFTEEHHKDWRSCGALSPYAKLIAHKGEILGLGLPPVYTTFLHVTEDMNLDEYPRKTYLDEEYNFSITDIMGEQRVITFKRRDPVLGSTLDLGRVSSHLSSRAHRNFFIFGVPCFWANAERLFDEMDELKKQGIILYE